MSGIPEDEQDKLGIRQRDEENPRFPGIAPPQAANSMNGVSLRGLGPVPAADPGGTSDLESHGLASHLAPPAIAKPSPLDTRKAGDEAELDRLQKTGSGISQIKNPFARGALRGLETVGNVLLPRTTAMIPGTEGHHNLLLQEQRGRVGEDDLQAEHEATAAKTSADADEASARARSLDATARAAGQPKAKEEDWGPFTGYTDVDGTPLIHEKNSGQVVRASDKQPPTSFKQAAPKTDKPDTPEQQFIDAEVKSGKTIEQAVSDYAARTQKPEREPRGEMFADPTGKVIEIKPGMTVPPGAKPLSKSGVPSADEQRRNDLATNLNENLDQLEDIVKRRPELFGPYAGRWTDLKGKFGSDDADIAALQTLEHQIGMAQISAHGMRSAHGIEGAAQSITNGLHSGPAAMMGAIATVRNSVGTFQKDVADAKREEGPKAGASAKDLGPAPQGKKEGSTGTLPDGTKIVVKGGRIVAQ